MPKLYLDTETRSECDLFKAGAYSYARHPTTRVLILTYAIEDGEVQIATDMENLPQDFLDCFYNPDYTVVAHNAEFDRWVLQFVLGLEIPIERWYCTMAKAFTCGLPGGLAAVGAAIGLEDDLAKIADGKRLIRLFSVPQVPRFRRAKDESIEDFQKRKEENTHWADRHTHPEDWELFCEYALQDVAAMRHIDKRLPDWTFKGFELSIFHLDQKINDRGIPVDLELAKAAAKLCDLAQEELNLELRTITDGAVEAHSLRDQVMTWLKAQGVNIQGYTKADISGLLEDPTIVGTARRVLEIRQQAGRTSTAKYVAFAKATSPDTKRIHGALKYYGAMRTGRWAGRQVQPQNFPRPSVKDTDLLADAILSGTASFLYDDMMDVGANALRPVIAAPAGQKFVVGDYSNIEGRMLAFLAGEDWKVKAFADFDKGIGHDIYKLSYSQSFGVAPEDVTDDERQIGKVLELALGYQGAVGAVNQMAGAFNLELPEENRIAEWVHRWRVAHPAIVRLWYGVEEAARAALIHPGKAYTAGKLAFKKLDKWLLARLPSGRFLMYYNAKLNKRGQIEYEGHIPGTRKWSVLDTYSGKLVENLVQGAARDIMAYNMPMAESRGYPVVATVHDELITLVNKDFGSPKDFESAMGQIPEWANGLPLSVGAWEGRRYRK